MFDHCRQMATGGGFPRLKQSKSETKQRSSNWPRSVSSDKDDSLSLTSFPSDIRINNWVSTASLSQTALLLLAVAGQVLAGCSSGHCGRLLAKVLVMVGGGWPQVRSGQVRWVVAGYRSGHGRRLLTALQVRSWKEVACYRSGHGRRLPTTGKVMVGGLLATGQVMVGGLLATGQDMVGGLLATGEMRCEVACYRSGCGGMLLASGQVMVGGCWLQVKSWWEVDWCRSGRGGRLLAAGHHGRRVLATGQVMVGGGLVPVRSWWEIVGCRSSW